MDGSARTGAIIAACITAAATIIGAYMMIRKPSPAPTLPSTFDYTGRVLGSGRQPLADAVVSIAEDQNPPQHIRTDTEGVFHAVLSKNSQNIQLDVEAEGYEHYKINVQPSRTGLEEILLKALPKPPPAADRPRPLVDQSRNLNKQRISDQWEHSGDRTAKGAIAIEIEVSSLGYQPKYTVTENPSTPYEHIDQGWKEARHDWGVALNQSADESRTARLREKMGPHVHLTCSDQATDGIYCFPNGTDSDVLEIAGQRKSSTLRK
jgi:hypothetical protein